MSDLLGQLSIIITRAVLPIAMFVGIVGNVLNIFVLTRPRLSKHASTHYFLAIAINNLFGSSFVPLNDLLSAGYRINIALISTASCKLVRYFSDLCAILALYFIVLASIDRYHMSSSNVNQRRLSSVKIARWLIIGLVTAFSLFYINTLVLIEFSLSDRIGCAIRSRTIYHRIYAIAQVILYTVVAPLLMAIFGFLAICNAHQAHRHAGQIHSHVRTERQLSVMLLVQVSTQLILTMPVSSLYLVYFFTPPQNLNAQFYFAFLMSRHIYQFSYATPFFLYIIAGQTFRKELINLFRKLTRQRTVYPTSGSSTVNHTRGGPPMNTQHITELSLRNNDAVMVISMV